MTRAAPPYIAVVRRGEREVYRTLKDYLEARGVAEVVWERRVGDRRTRAERRVQGEAARPEEERRARREAGATDRRAEDRRFAPLGTRVEVLGFFIARRTSQPRTHGRTRTRRR